MRTARSAGLDSGGSRLPWEFLGWLGLRLVALALLLGSAWVVYDSASSDRFQVRSVHVEGNLLLTQSDIEQAAAIGNANVFWIDRRQVEVRLKALPTVLRAEVTPILPGTADVEIVERRPAAFWASGEQTYLVDSEGTILKAVDEATARLPQACGGQSCDPAANTSLPKIVQTGGDLPVPGGHVDPRILAASNRLASLLPQAGIQPLAFEWSTDGGVEVPTSHGWRVRFNPERDLGPQMVAVQAIEDNLRQTNQSAELIDVRFADRPYYR